jgi:hypothetical protein
VCNESAAADPPVLRDDMGQDYGRLSVSQTRAGSVCGQESASRVCRVLLIICNS